MSGEEPTTSKRKSCSSEIPDRLPKLHKTSPMMPKTLIMWGAIFCCNKSVLRSHKGRLSFDHVGGSSLG